jgi:hypothetical protein
VKRSTLETDINNWLDHADEVTGKTILDFLEARGMQPPENEKANSGTKMAGEAYYWEPEDG